MYGRARPAAVCIFAALLLLAAPSLGTASHSGPGGPRDFTTGSGKNEFLVVVGEAHLSVAAHAGPPGGEPTGHVRAKGDPDGPGPMEPFALEGAVTCIDVTGNRAAVKYEFKHAEGSAEEFEGGGVQIFIEDNGNPASGPPRDRTTFDPPQFEGEFQALGMHRVCQDPATREGFDEIQSGNFLVHDG
jgi:hypothetical protein